MNKLVEYKPTEQILFVPNIDEEDYKIPNVTIPAEAPGSTVITTPDNYDYVSKLAEIRSKMPVEVKESIQTNTPAKVTGTADYEKIVNEYINLNPNDKDDLDILTRLARIESGFNFGAENAKTKAFGAYQIMPFNFAGSTREQLATDPLLQIKTAIGLLRKQRKVFNEKDYKRAAELGYSRADLDTIAWFSGPQGARNFIHKGINASDGNNTISQYLAKINKARQGGSLEEGKSLIEIGRKQYKIKIAETDEEKSVGLSNLKELPKDEGMLFIIKDDEKDEDDLVWFTMEDTKFPLDIVFLDDDFEVTQVSKGEPLSSEPIYGKGDYVLEVNSDSGIRIDDELEFVSEKEVNKKMIVLDSEGKPQMTLDGGERIFSIKNTKVLIKFAKKASVSNKDNDYKALGKRVFKFLDLQDSTPAEYV